LADKKVFPQRLKISIREVPGVKEVAVLAKPHAFLGQLIVARIRPSF